MLVLEQAGNNENLLPSPVPMGVKSRASRPTHQGDMLGAEPVQGQHAQTRDKSLTKVD